MQMYEGYFENGKFYITGDTTNIKGKRKAIITILDEPVKKPRSESKGILKGKIHISDDFDDPVDELKEYME